VNDKIVSIKSDLCFGDNGTVIHRLLSNIVNKRNIVFHPSSLPPSPIHVDNLAQIVN